MSKPMALLVSKFLSLKKVSSFVIFLKIKELELYQLCMARTLGCLNAFFWCEVNCRAVIKTAFTYSGKIVNKMLHA